MPNAQVSFKVPTDSGLVNNTGAVVHQRQWWKQTIEVEIKELAKATTALQKWFSRLPNLVCLWVLPSAAQQAMPILKPTSYLLSPSKTDFDYS
ncbi:MAG: hypothetical protein U1E98_05790 [Moraxella osloensis]